MVRIEAFKSLIHILNKHITPERYNLLREVYPVEIYKVIFGIKSDSDFNHPTTFYNVSDYLLRIKIIKCLKYINPTSNFEIILNTKNVLYRLWKSKTNISNIFLDCCYRSQILKTLGHLLLTLKSRGNIFI